MLKKKESNISDQILQEFIAVQAQERNPASDLPGIIAGSRNIASQTRSFRGSLTMKILSFFITKKG